MWCVTLFVNAIKDEHELVSSAISTSTAKQSLQMDRQSTEILRANISTAIYLLACLRIHSIKTCSNCALEEVAASDTFSTLDNSMDQTTMGEDCSSDGRFASSIKAVYDKVGW